MPECSADQKETSFRVLYLVNFLAPDLLAVCRRWKELLGNLAILVSVPMEGNRNWRPDHEGLNVVTQRTWTITKSGKHPSGYSDVSFIHIPLDTYQQIRRIRPDVIVSAELGVRSLMASLYRRLNSRCRLVIAVSTSEHIEQSREGALRRFQRRRLLRNADLVTYNGDSCRQYVMKLGVAEGNLYPWIYAADPTKPFHGPLRRIQSDAHYLSLLTVGQLIERKGVLNAAEQLARWCSEHPDAILTWTLVGSGPCETSLKNMPFPPNLKIDFWGNCDADRIRQAYETHECMLFPTLGDEWGLVTDEALASGVAVIGSDKAQSCPALIRDGENGFVYDPLQTDGLANSLNQWFAMSAEQRMQMRIAARESMSSRTYETSSDQIATVCRLLLTRLREEG